jgi:hypothetical protein
MTLNAHDNPSVGNKMITPRAAELQKCKKPDTDKRPIKGDFIWDTLYTIQSPIYNDDMNINKSRKLD